ncbi:MAG: sulfotransferase [Rhodanobacteraceae bacterium]
MSEPIGQTEQQWLEQVRALMLRGDHTSAESVVSVALQEYPRSFELRRILAGIYNHTRRAAAAESLLSELLAERPDDPGSAFTLARTLIDQCRSSAAAAVMRACFEHARHNAELAIQAIELLDDCNRKRDAAAIAEHAIVTDPDDPRLHAYAGMLEIQLGEFERARDHYLYALQHASQACEWHVPTGLALMQRYRDAEHPDFARFRDCLQRQDLSGKARSNLLFALAKAHDDIGDYAGAAEYSRHANALAHTLTTWSRKHWRRAVEAQLAVRPIRQRLESLAGFVPVFIVGVPRSGTTLVAELLARRPRVCNRGESPWLARLAQQPDLTGDSKHTALQRAAATYAAQLRQDDADDARWFIDKQPLNFRYVDLIFGLFPNARIIHCRRNERDNALSLWMQSFVEDVQGYAYDFSDIALVMHDCARLMTRWRDTHAGSMRPVRYEQLVAAPEATIAELAAWLELPPLDLRATPATASTSISTGSLWQARQRVYASSAGRWNNYAPYLPELLEFQRDQSLHSVNQ